MSRYPSVSVWLVSPKVGGMYGLGTGSSSLAGGKEIALLLVCTGTAQEFQQPWPGLEQMAWLTPPFLPQDPAANVDNG